RPRGAHLRFTVRVTTDAEDAISDDHCMTQTVPGTTHPVQQRYADPATEVPTQWNPVLQVLHEHKSVRRYLPDAVSPETIELLVSAAQSAATSSNLQVWSVIEVRDA